MNGRSPAARAGAIVLATVALLAMACKRDNTSSETAGAGNTGRGNARWAMYNGTYDGQRWSPLDQITTQNVAQLAPVCSVYLGEDGSFQSGPLVLGDTLVVTTPHSTAALDATNCKLLWRNVDSTHGKDVFPVNRGAAALDGRIYRGTPDGRIVALDMRNGAVLWTAKIGDPTKGEFTSSAPIAWNGMVFTGLAGSDWGIHGRMFALDAASGKVLWTFNTIPQQGEPGFDTWPNVPAAQRGGGAQWTSYALDTTASEVFIPVANPAPDFAPQARPGSNLYSNSLVVLDAKTGKLKWYYQISQNDGLDWDLGAAPMLFGGGSGRVALGSKDGHVYAVDRSSHKLVWNTAVTTIKNFNAKPTTAGIDVCPGPLGGVEWNGPAYDQKTNTIYAGAVDWCGHYVTHDSPPYKPGGLYMGTSYTPVQGATTTGWLTAINADDGKMKWQFHAPQPIVAGVTPTAGGIVFNGDLAGNLYAFDASNGKVLYTYKTPGAIAGGIVTYMVNGKQYVATTSGNVSRTTFQTTGSPMIIILAVGPQARAQVESLPPVPTTQGGASPTEHAKEGAAKGSTTGPK